MAPLGLSIDSTKVPRLDMINLNMKHADLSVVACLRNIQRMTRTESLHYDFVHFLFANSPR